MSKISIIIPVYNVAAYLEKCVSSIRDQSYTDFELILVDDGSTDGSSQLCDEFAFMDPRIRVIHQTNGGAASARNTGLDWVRNYSNSEWLAFIDSDDWVHKRYLELLLKTALRHGAMICKCKHVPASIATPDKDIDDFDSSLMATEDAYLLNNNAASPWAKIYQRKCFEEIRYPEDRFAEDMFTTYRVMFQYDTVAVLDAELYYYRFNPDSLTNSKWKSKQLDEFDAFEEQLTFFSERGMKTVRNKLAGRYLWAIGRQFSMLSSGHADDADVKKYTRYMRVLMQKVIWKYAMKARLPFREYIWCYEIAYPKTIRSYWRFCVLRNKIKERIL